MVTNEKGINRRPAQGIAQPNLRTNENKRKKNYFIHLAKSSKRDKQIKKNNLKLLEG